LTKFRWFVHGPWERKLEAVVETLILLRKKEKGYEDLDMGKHSSIYGVPRVVKYLKGVSK